MKKKESEDKADLLMQELSKAERRRILRSIRASQKEAEALEAAREEEKQRIRFMKEAIRQAYKAEALGEVPIGCVIVKDGKIIGRGYNRRNTDHTTLAHAEISAIKKACRVTGDWRLEDCDLYVTLEPCPMCAGAILQSRMKRVILGCYNPKAGCAGSILNVLQMKEFNHQVEIVDGVLEEECSHMLKEYFRNLRLRLRMERKNSTPEE
ncbi:MAG: tRNA adenosine(34) deaminase TadA [Lachnospiraceae bacterium]|nr:tRNA adenosine(34) deaminase TadA [Lachnospiraceae bacterium]